MSDDRTPENCAYPSLDEAVALGRVNGSCVGPERACPLCADGEWLLYACDHHEDGPALHCPQRSHHNWPGWTRWWEPLIATPASGDSTPGGAA